jgi:8-oxo-dGTP pyrophosphatase MutT (NUDIX family)
MPPPYLRWYIRQAYDGQPSQSTGVGPVRCILMAMIGMWLRRAFRRGFLGARGRGHGGPPGLLAPRCPIGAAVLIRDPQGRVLLVQQSYRSSSVWLPPGGWMDRGETPQEAARREAWEEVGLRVRIGRPLAIGGGGYGEVTVLFEGHSVGETSLHLSDEIERAAYFPLDALPPMAEQTWHWLAEACVALGIEPPVVVPEAGKERSASGHRPATT